MQEEQFPLWKFFEDLPIDHWLCRYRTLPAGLFLEPTSGTLPLIIRRPGSYTRHPYLLFRLYREVVAEGSLRFLPLVSSWLKLHPPMVFPHLTPEALRLQLTTSHLWRNYSSQAFRMHNYFAAINRRVPISSSLLAKFWNLRVHLPVRTLGYRTFHRLLPTAQWLHQIGIRDSPLCTYCRQIESHDHFLAECPVRWSIWVEILVAYFPHHYFTPTEVIDVLQLTALPTALASSTYSLLTVVYHSLGPVGWSLALTLRCSSNST
ncbi:hypothetical protein EDC96DRAFT_515339 [Choanephora cucurbitarum]|nr:hypothetical protein EDC96DRAFT_515339 [Choanephora cucurbitarum]